MHQGRVHFLKVSRISSQPLGPCTLCGQIAQNISRVVALNQAHWISLQDFTSTEVAMFASFPLFATWSLGSNSSTVGQQPYHHWQLETFFRTCRFNHDATCTDCQGSHGPAFGSKPKEKGDNSLSLKLCACCGSLFSKMCHQFANAWLAWKIWTVVVLFLFYVLLLLLELVPKGSKRSLKVLLLRDGTWVMNS